MIKVKDRNREVGGAEGAFRLVLNELRGKEGCEYFGNVRYDGFFQLLKAIINNDMKSLQIIILIGFLTTLICCKNLADNQRENIETKRDSIIQDCLKEYFDYLNKEGNREFSVITYSYENQDTISFLITCNILNDITLILADSMKFVYTIKGHYVFTKEDFFSSLQKIDFNSTLRKLDPETYKRIQEKVEPGLPKIHWDCKFLYLVLKNDKVLRKEIRFFDTKPEMWKNNF